jgi:hypothetical protein
MHLQEEVVTAKNLFRPRPKAHPKEKKKKVKKETIAKKEKKKKTVAKQKEKAVKRERKTKVKTRKKKETVAQETVKTETKEELVINVKLEAIPELILPPKPMRLRKVRAAHNLGLRGEVHNQGLIDMMTVASIRPEAPNIELDEQSEEESEVGSGAEDDEPLLAMEVNEEEMEEEDAVPYEILSQARTTKVLGSKVKYKVRWCDEHGDGMKLDVPGAWSMELAEVIEQDPAYTKLVSEWKKRRAPKYNSKAWQVL